MAIQWLIPTLKDKEDQTKAKILVFVTLTSILILLILFLVNQSTGAQSDFPFLSMAIGFTGLLVLFRLSASLFIIGNLIAASMCWVLVNLGLTTGGIFSEDIHCMYLVPLIAFLIVGIRSGIFWLIFAFGVTLYIFNYASTPEEIQVYRNQTLRFNKSYYLIISSVNLIVTSVLMTIFHFQFRKSISILKQNKNALELQTNQLKIAEQRLLKSNDALDQYAYTTAHDLKQPIRTIHSFTSLLSRELKKEKPNVEKKEEYLNVIQKSSTSMNQMVSDLLEYSKLSNIDNLYFKKINLAELLDEVINNLQDSIGTTKTSINRKTMPTIIGNKVQLNQLFQNLIYNAIKFRNQTKDSKILIDSKEDDHEFIFSITDNGIGIAKKDLEEIFAPFNKLHGSSEYEGSGIGLATCKRITEHHGGKIWAESNLGEGTTFYFSISKNLTEV